MKETKRKKIRNHSYYLKAYPYLEEYSLYRTFLVHDTNTIEQLLCSIGEAFNLPFSSCSIFKEEYDTYVASPNDFEFDFSPESPQLKSKRLKTNQVLTINYDEFPFYLRVVEKFPLLEDDTIKLIDSIGEWDLEAYEKVSCEYQNALYWMYGRDD